MGNIEQTVPIDLARRLVRTGKIMAAIETGTFRGEGASALSTVVPRVWTIELLESLFDQARHLHGEKNNIQFCLGSSPDVLRALSHEVDVPLLFWLDAHGGAIYHLDRIEEPKYRPTDTGYSQCPLLDELDAIRGFPCASESVILIDDARAFISPLLNRRVEDWPTLTDVFDALRQEENRFVTVIDEGVGLKLINGGDGAVALRRCPVW